MNPENDIQDEIRPNTPNFFQFWKSIIGYPRLIPIRGDGTIDDDDGSKRDDRRMPKGSIRSWSQNTGNLVGNRLILSNKTYGEEVCEHGNSIFVLASTNLQEISETHIQDRDLDQKPEYDFANTDPSPVRSPNVRETGQGISEYIIENLNMEKYCDKIFEKDYGKHFQVSFAPPQTVLREYKEENTPKVNNLMKPSCSKVESSYQSKRAV